MNKLVQVLLLGIAGLAALIAAGPTLTAILHQLVPLILVVGVVAAVLQVINYFIRR